jgi:hypothetical protein
MRLPWKSSSGVEVVLSDTNDPAEPFERMARKITDNTGRGFSGAFVVVPPDGKPMDLLYLAEQSDVAVFWSTLKTMVEIELGKIADRERGRTQGW